MASKDGNNNAPGKQRWSDEDPVKTYKLVKRLDSGASGEVWLARNRSTKAEVAIKIICLEAELLEELETEIDALSKCSSEFVTRFYGSYRKGEAIWIVMEYADVGSLQDLLQYCLRPLKEDEIRSVCASVLAGLSYLHSLGILHRDIKAKNILINSAGRVILADFGVAGLMQDKAGKRRTAIGSPHWMAPEVITESEYDGRADVWSLGITALELAEMEPPYADMPIHEVLLAIPAVDPPSVTEPDMWSSVFKSFLQECLVKNPAARKSASAMLQHPFVATEVAKQRSGDFGCLRKMVKESTQRMLWLNEGADGSDGEDPGEEPPRKSLAARLSARLSVGSGGAIRRLSHSLRSVKSEEHTDDGTASDEQHEALAASATKRMPRKSKKLVLLKRPSFRKSRHGTPLVVDSAGATATKSEMRPAAALSTSSDSTTTDEAAERAERERKAEELKQRLFRLYTKFDNGTHGGDKPPGFFDNFGKVSQ